MEVKRYVVSASWCSQCQVLKRMLNQAGIEYQEIDADEPDNSEFIEMHKVRSLPTTLIYCGDNQPIVVAGVKKVEEYL